MAIDSESKRRIAFSSIVAPLPVADGSISALDRAHLQAVFYVPIVIGGINTTDKRRAAWMSIIRFVPNPDGTIDAFNRGDLQAVYNATPLIPPVGDFDTAAKRRASAATIIRFLEHVPDTEIDEFDRAQLQGLYFYNGVITVPPPVVVVPVRLVFKGELGGTITVRSGTNRLIDIAYVESLGFIVEQQTERAGEATLIVTGVLSQVLQLGESKLRYPAIFWKLPVGEPLTVFTILSYRPGPGGKNPRSSLGGLIYADFPSA